MSSKEINLLSWFYAIPRQARYPLLVLLVSTPFIIGVVLFKMSWLIPYQVIAVATVIIIQIWNARRSFHKCKNCGHERHMHDKQDLIKKGFGTMANIICDNFDNRDGLGKFTNPNYDRKYWNGQDPRNDIGGI